MGFKTAGSFKIQVLKRSQVRSLWSFVRHLDIHYFNRLQKRNEWNQLWMGCDKANMMGWHQKFNLNCSGFKYYWVKYYNFFDISFGYVWKVSVKFWECPEQWDTRYKEVCVLVWHGPLDFHRIWKSVTATLGCIMLIRWHGALAHASLKAWGRKGRTHQQNQTLLPSARRWTIVNHSAIVLITRCKDSMCCSLVNRFCGCQH